MSYNFIFFTRYPVPEEIFLIFSSDRIYYDRYLDKFATIEDSKLYLTMKRIENLLR